MSMTQDQIEILKHLGAALLAGGLIGLERSYHGRPAGFRTHALVCIASSMLMLVTVFQAQWFQPLGLERVSLDPTRMAQGIMTGIGFLGAGVIMKPAADLLRLGTPVAGRQGMDMPTTPTATPAGPSSRSPSTFGAPHEILTSALAHGIPASGRDCR